MFRGVKAWLTSRAALGVRNQYLTKQLTADEMEIVVDLSTAWALVYDRHMARAMPPADLLYVMAYFFDTHVHPVQDQAKDGQYSGVSPEWVRVLAFGAMLVEGHVSRNDIQSVLMRI